MAKNLPGSWVFHSEHNFIHFSFLPARLAATAGLSVANALTNIFLSIREKVMLSFQHLTLCRKHWFLPKFVEFPSWLWGKHPFPLPILLPFRSYWYKDRTAANYKKTSCFRKTRFRPKALCWAVTFANKRVYHTLMILRNSSNFSSVISSLKISSSPICDQRKCFQVAIVAIFIFVVFLWEEMFTKALILGLIIFFIECFKFLQLPFSNYRCEASVTLKRFLSFVYSKPIGSSSWVFEFLVAVRKTYWTRVVNHKTS